MYGLAKTNARGSRGAHREGLGKKQAAPYTWPGLANIGYAMPASTVNMLEAKSSLSRLVAALEDGTADEFIIARNGRPAARLVPLAGTGVDRSRRIGLAKGRFEVPAPAEGADEEVLRLIEGR
jgi:antitoxin (DNA-binding transcriptional repressor) of toxin-antitoxin stability system